jgi:hypothetical protein
MARPTATRMVAATAQRKLANAIGGKKAWVALIAG